MDLYAIHKLYQTGGQGTITSGSTSEKSLWDSHFADREEFARFLNMMLAKSPLMEGTGLRPFDVNYDDSSAETPLSSTTAGMKPRGGGTTRPSSTDFVSSLLSPFSQGTGRITSSYNTSGSSEQPSGSAKLPTLADQFTWGAVVCAGVFIVVFVCVMAAWWVHKRQQERAQSRLARAQSRPSAEPYCIANDPRLASTTVDGQTGTVATIQRPPSYFEVIGFFDPPPSYSDVLRVGNGSRRDSHIQSGDPASAYDNVAITIDELPPPFVEGDYVMKSGHQEDLDLHNGAITTTSGDASASSSQVTVIIPHNNSNNTGEGTSHC